MKQRLLCILIISFLLAGKAYSQEDTARTVCCCSTIISELSTGWKADSLANNNFRFLNYKRLLTCKIDTVSARFLVEKFGEANLVKEIAEGYRYLYLYYDDKALGSKNPVRAAGIYFDFSFDKKVLNYTGSFVLDY